jgi:hypothetical protein
MGCFGTLSMTAFSRAYSWLFDPSIVSHSISHIILSDHEHEEQQQRLGQQHQQPGQPPNRIAHCQPEPADAGSAANSSTSTTKPHQLQQLQHAPPPPPQSRLGEFLRTCRSTLSGQGSHGCRGLVLMFHMQLCKHTELSM